MATFDASLLAGKTAFRRALAAWFARAQRTLPWRTERSLYRTVVSEFMLQQTQVATVLPYFERWMQALPDFATLATASEATVLKLWEGLGYYRRARFLHTLARELGARATTPETATEWMELTGIGPYTAAAIASLSSHDRAPCVDGNVVRILARLTGDTRQFSDGSTAVKNFTLLATALLDPRHPGRHNEAMMELGATVCLRRKPRCAVCPVARFCAARQRGIAEKIPRVSRPVTEKREVVRIWCVRHGALLLHLIPQNAARMRALHELPTAERAGIDPAQLDDGSLLATHRRAITRYQITERIHRVESPSDAELVWMPLAQIDRITMSGPHRRWVAALLATEAAAVSLPPRNAARRTSSTRRSPRD